MAEYMYDPMVWLCFAALVALLEFVLIPGIGILMFAGSLALMAPLVHYGFIHNENDVFFAISMSFLLFMFLFLRPLRTFYGKGLPPIKCAIGEHAEVVQGPISKSISGRIRYSNGEMYAVLDFTDSVNEVHEGDLVEVLSIKGTVAQVASSYKDDED